ncbi:DUF6226 family protein [Pseudokineococcus sp. 5B2Z-1]|uniref:DUF6226 family protein n=1 Tax=Pseudokineococcus sp. 5B2Z-1 TaxID=3132744 RepID=UPI003096C5FA
MDLQEVLRRVDTAFAETSGGTPGWPNPHAGGREPAPEEYSRESDPGKYRILAARVQAWSQVLVEAGVAHAEVLDGAAVAWRGRLTTGLPVVEAVRLCPTDRDAVPLVLATRAEVDGAATVLSVGAGDPAHEVELVPDCSCDACDQGSQDLLESLDERVMDVVSGALVHVATPEGYVQERREGMAASSGGTPIDARRVLADLEAGRSRYPVVRGGPWW